MGAGVTVTPTQRRHARLREEALDAAWRLAARDGIAGVSLREVAAEVGLRPPSLYTYFPSKAAIYDAMFVQGYAQFDAAYTQFEVAPADPLRSLTRSIETFLDFAVASPARFQLLFTHAVPGWAPSEEAYTAARNSYANMVEHLRGLGITDTADHDLLTALTTGLASQQLANEPGGDRWRRLARDAAAMFLAHHRRSRG
ncbi:MAG TPA: TetR/AcrR family transcriptional regulator [Egicoccus sp.]|nr:TetR/AcrR family transcriptional regulator [Egicoccus sp.]HSK24457.1 TetR/AcrR family transcriptional regulator [Egicoccus sp.]